MTFKYLTIDQVLYIHERVLEGTKEDRNLSSHTSLKSTLNRIDDHIFYDGISDIFDIAALYAVSLTKGHCFNNGNKRTAMVSMGTFLFINDIFIFFNIKNKEIEDMMVDIATDKINKKDLAQWIKSKVFSIEV